MQSHIRSGLLFPGGYCSLILCMLQLLLASYVFDHCHTVLILVNTELLGCYQLCELCTSPLRLWQATAVSIPSYSECGVLSLWRGWSLAKSRLQHGGQLKKTSPSAVSGEWPCIGIGFSGLGLYYRQEWVF